MRSHLFRFAPLLAFVLALTAAPLCAGVIYDNGPINGNLNAWIVDGDHQVTNSFQLSSRSTITGIVFGAWAYPGRTGISVDWAITATPFGTPLASGTAALSNLFLFSNDYGAAVWQESFTIPAQTLGAGTYWLELDDTLTDNDRYFWWDQSNGASQAQRAGIDGAGPINSEAFQILGDPAPPHAAPEPGSAALLGSGALLLSVALASKRRLFQ